jgi:hypothetical protein
MAFDARDNEIQLVGADPLAIVAAVLAALQDIVGALGGDLAGPLDLIGLGADMAADHAVDVGHLFEDGGSFLLERR